MPRRKSPKTPSDELAVQNHKLKEQLREAKNREKKLIERLASIESRYRHDETKDDAGRMLNEQGELACFEERFVEQKFQAIVETASKIDDAKVILFEYKRLYKVYLAIKNQNERIQQKYTSTEQDRVFLKQTLLECYKLPFESQRQFLDNRWKERKQTRFNYKTKKLMVEKLPSSSQEATSYSKGNDGAFLQTSKQPLVSKADLVELSSEQPTKITKEGKGADNRVGDEDAMCIGESVDDNANLPFEDSRNDVKGSTTESCSLEKRAKLTCNRFDWVSQLVCNCSFDSSHLLPYCVAHVTKFETAYLKRIEQEENTGEKRTFQQYLTELMSYKGIMGNFDILPDHARLGDLGKFVAFLRVEHDKFHQGEESLLSVKEIEQLDVVNFEWKDIGIRKLLKRKRRTSSS